MARFYNDTTKVVVSVADEKAGRFTSGWTALADGESEPSKSRGGRKAADKPPADPPTAD